jgi:hypothetical protein
VRRCASRPRVSPRGVPAAVLCAWAGPCRVRHARPSIQRDLPASLPDLQWVSAAYALVLAVLLLPAATLGDRLGRRRPFLVGMVIFTVGSLACALAATAVQLELFRALQGVGGAVLFATATGVSGSDAKEFTAASRQGRPWSAPLVRPACRPRKAVHAAKNHPNAGRRLMPDDWAGASR